LARHLLSLSESERAPTASECVDLNEILLQNRRLLEASLPSEAVLSYELAPNLPPACADNWDLQGICVSLLMNAGEALEGGTGIVTVFTDAEETSEEISSRESPTEASWDDRDDPRPLRYVWTEVRDDGHGIPESDLDKVQEPFFTTRPERRGIGLFYVRTVTRAFRGKVRIHSSAEGTRVRVLIPQANLRQRSDPALRAHQQYHPQPTPTG